MDDSQQSQSKMPRIDDYLLNTSLNTSIHGGGRSVHSFGGSTQKLNDRDKALLAEFSV